ncbi:LAMI_0D04170g1_1 [Lachancea mirantina]|uniref:LAMI_0D04170g1_1 n=1 Tax=Lachancea mirantina TaxID=1230905 RepID=A0A1G4JA68_9SACH|nr:LAMI_0D04170g1_1 [Lachancea mirantina]
MSGMSFNNRNTGDPQGNEAKFATTTGGKSNPKQIHIAHRRSASELTSLMIEQFTLQRQLEIVQAQQQQLLAQQQELAHQSGQFLAPHVAGSGGAGFVPQPPRPHYNMSPSPSQSNRSRSHSRNNSGFYSNNSSGGGSNANTNNTGNDSQGGHRRTASQSGVYGHSRRHSLGLNEAKKAAAEEQAKRASGSGVSIRIGNAEESQIPSPSNSTPGSGSGSEQMAFKFPASPSSGEKSAQSSKGANVSPNKSFQFPAKPCNKENQDSEFTLVGTPHRRSNSRNKDMGGINTNWRSQQGQNTPHSPYNNHRKSQSRDHSSFGTLEPPPVFQPGHKPRGSNASTQSFGMGGGNGNGRKSLFAPYLPQANIPELLQEGRLVCGILRVNKKNRSDAWVSTDGVLDADIYICGSKDRNRALEGDLVAVELLMVDDVWGSKKEKEEKKRRKDATSQQDIPLNTNEDYHNDASSYVASATHSGLTPPIDKEEKSSTSTSGSIKRRGSLKQRPTQKKNDDVEVEGQSLLLVEEEEISDNFKPLYAGHVVAVLDRIPGQLFSGTLGLVRPSQQANNDANKPQKPKIVWFKPTDKKVPLIAIPTEQAPKDFVENSESYANKLFVASIKRWPITSLHPFGTLISQLGVINDRDTEIDAILRDNNFLSDEYLDPVDKTKERDIYQPLQLSSEDLESRLHIDGVVALQTGDLSDMAVHIEKLSDGISLGCHILDVTSHIESGSSLDRRARKRSSSVFIPQKVVNLLPEALNAALTMEVGKPSATISVLYKLDHNLKMQGVTVCESLVVPSLVKSLDDIEEEIVSNKPSEFVTNLRSIATAFYRQRLHNQDLDLSSGLSLLESLDDEKVKVELNIFEQKRAASIVTEIQRQVNATVAEKIYQKLGDLAFLRRQGPPIFTKLASFRKKVEKFGYQIDVSDAQTLISSLLSIEDPHIRTATEILLFKTLGRAKYFVAGKVEPDQYEQFSLNLPIYTHFTAPLRRYGDHVVHRQLKAVIKGTSCKEDEDSLKITSEYCNFKKDCAYHAQEQAIHSLLCKTINSMGNTTGQLLTMAIVLQVYESSFDVFIPDFGIEKRVHGDQLPLLKAEFDAENRVLELFWQKNVDSATFVPLDEQNPKSYRNSIKNKFKSATSEIAASQLEKDFEHQSLLTDELAAELERLHIKPPTLSLPKSDDANALEPYLKSVQIHTEGDNNIQEIHELQRIPVLLRAEIGMALPCLTVRAVNPFMKRN